MNSTRMESVERAVRVKVATVNFHFAHNYGAVLQALALQDRLRSFGCDVLVVDYRPKGHAQKYRTRPNPFRSARWKYGGARAVGSGVVDAGVQALRRGVSAALEWRNRKERQEREQRFEAFLQRFLNSSPRYKSLRALRRRPPMADLYIVGSDQVWNPTNTGGIDPAYFLDFGSDATLRVAYAASAVQLDTAKHAGSLAPLLGRLDYISVREGGRARDLTRISGHVVATMPDPVMLMPPEAFRPYMSEISPGEPYILVYAVRTQVTYPVLAEYLRRLQDGLGIRVLDISLEGASWPFPVEYRADVGPSEFVSLIANASYVVSNSFHATAFALLFERQFGVVAESGTGERMAELLGRVGLTHRMVHDVEDLADLLEAIPYEQVRPELERLRRQGSEYLRKVIAVAQERVGRLN